jgi:hypothetical protein
MAEATKRRDFLIRTLERDMAEDRRHPIAPLKEHPEFPRYSRPERLIAGRLVKVADSDRLRIGEYDG